MMISPESYIELEIKGRTPEKICSKIRGLQRDMAQLKNKAENEMSFEDVVIHPTPQVQIDMIREYITAARNYLAELGYDYPLSKMEQRSYAFQENIRYIKSITVGYGGFFGGEESRTITHDDDKIVVRERIFYNGAADDGQPLYEGRIWSDLLKELSSIHIGEWRTKYDNRDIMDGVQWSVDIEYENDLKPRHYWGSNKFPYNFDRFLEIMEME